MTVKSTLFCILSFLLICSQVMGISIKDNLESLSTGGVETYNCGLNHGVKDCWAQCKLPGYYNVGWCYTGKSCKSKSDCSPTLNCKTKCTTGSGWKSMKSSLGGAQKTIFGYELLSLCALNVTLFLTAIYIYSYHH